MYKIATNIKSIDLIVIICFSILIAIIVSLTWWILGGQAFIVALTFLTAFILFVTLEVYRRCVKNIDDIKDHINKRGRNEYLQVEMLQWLYTTLKPSAPLPYTRGWAASPDFLKLISEIILSEKPQLILEAGSGVSTLIAAYCLDRVGTGGKIISLEHDPEYAKASKDCILQHNLQDISTVIHAPFKETNIKGKRWFWYNMDNVTITRPIDLLI